MKNLTILFLAALLLSSCSIFKKSNKELKKTALDSTVKMHAISHSFDTTRTVIRESIDTSVHIPGYTVSAELKLRKGADGKYPEFIPGIIAIDTAITSLKIYYDSLDHSVKVLNKVKDQVVPFRYGKITEIKAGITKDLNVKKEAYVKKKTEDKKTETKPTYTWLWFVIFVAILLFFFWPTARR